MRKGKRLGVKIGIAEKLEKRTMILVATRLCRDIDLANLAAEFRRIDTALNLELLERIDGWEEGIAITFDVSVLEPIERVVVEHGAGASD